MATQYAGGPILTIAVSAGGSGYTVAPTVTLSGIGNGFGAAFTVNLTSGAVTSVTVTAGGHLYPISGVTATFTGGTGGSGAVAGAVTVSGGDYNAPFTSDGTKQNLINNMETALLAAGWTTISGHATTNLLMQTHATPYPITMNFRFKDNAGAGIQISIEATSGSPAGGSSTTAGCHLLPVNARVYRVIANPYQFCVFAPGIFSTGSTFVFGCVPFIPSFITGVTAAGFICGNSPADNATGATPGWRLQLINGGGGVTNNNQQAIWNTGIIQVSNAAGSNSYAACVNLIIPQTCNYAVIGTTQGTTFYQPYRWANLQIHSADPIVAWGGTAQTDESLMRGIIWDATILEDAYPGDSTSTWDSHNWWGLTANNNGGNTQGTNSGGSRGTLFLVTP